MSCLHNNQRGEDRDGRWKEQAAEGEETELTKTTTNFLIWQPIFHFIILCCSRATSSVRLISLSYGTVLVWAHHRQLGVAPCRQQHIPLPLNAFNRIVYFRRTASYTVGGGEARRGSLKRREKRKLKNINYHTDCLKLCAHVVNPTIIPAEDKTKF